MCVLAKLASEVKNRQPKHAPGDSDELQSPEGVCDWHNPSVNSICQAQLHPVLNNGQLEMMFKKYIARINKLSSNQAVKTGSTQSLSQKLLQILTFDRNFDVIMDNIVINNALQAVAVHFF